MPKVTDPQPGWRQSLVEYIRQEANPPDKFSHQARLYRLAAELASGTEHDDDVLFAAAWLHDLGVFVGHRPEDLDALAKWDHVTYVLKQLPKLLTDFGFPAQKVPAVAEAIRTHMPQCEPTTIEGTILRDADILEQLGAVAILRTVSKVGRDTRFIRFGDALRVLQRNGDELPAQLRLPNAKEHAVERLKTLKAFLAAAERERLGEPW